MSEMSDPKRRLNMVHGLPDDLKVSLRFDDAGQMKLTRPGTPSFLEQIVSDRSFNDVWLGPGTPSQTQFNLFPTVNYIADADISGLALQAALTLSRSVRVAWFNHPQSVLNNTRDRLFEALAGIPGVVIPQTVRLSSPTKDQLVAAIEAFALHYPVIVRTAGVHGGKSTLLIHSADDFDLRFADWAGRELYVSQFLDCRSTDGLYRKHRVAIIGGIPVLRHLIVGSDWMLSAGSRLDRPELRHEEEGALKRFDGRSPQIAGQIDAIYRRLALDYFGLDCLIQDDGRLVIFEANPTMNILLNSFPSPNMWDAPIARAKTALLDLLDHPERWICSARTAELEAPDKSTAQMST